MQYIKADTNTEVLIGPVVAVGDAFTPVTTLSLSTADEAEIIKYGGATPLTVTSISANGFAAITSADGYYTLDISTSNSDTEGFLTVLINDDSLCLPVRCDFMVVNANVYDSLFAAATTDYLQTDVAQWLGTAAATPTTAGVPEVDVTFVSGTAQTANDNGADINSIKTKTDSLTFTVANEVDSNVITKTGFSLAATGLDAIVSTATGMVEIAKAIWNRVLSGATHNITNSAGKRVRQIDAAFEVHSGTAQAGGAASITLDTGASATDDIYRGDRIIIVAGTGAGEHDICTAYNGTTKVATVAETWVITPDATSEVILVPASVDIETWQHTAVSNGATSGFPVVDAQAISDNTAAADNVQANIGNLDAAISTVPTAVENRTEMDSNSTQLAAAVALFTTQLTEAYAADGVAPTPAQSLMLIQQVLTEFAISGTTITVKKLDGTTTAATLTLDDGTNPTSATRAT